MPNKTSPFISGLRPTLIRCQSNTNKTTLKSWPLNNQGDWSTIGANPPETFDIELKPRLRQ